MKKINRNFIIYQLIDFNDCSTLFRSTSFNTPSVLKDTLPNLKITSGADIFKTLFSGNTYLNQVLKNVAIWLNGIFSRLS